ncbi:hypothetical protein BH09VER1_BH09VER1_18740 [soil metagenome]
MAVQPPKTKSADEYLCVCAKITMEDFEAKCRTCPGRGFDYYRETFNIANTCTSCETEVRSLLDDFSPTGTASPHSWRTRWQKSLRLIRQRRFREALKFGTKNSLGGVFFLSSPLAATSLVISNLPIPESGTNLNGAFVRYRISLYGGDEGRLAARREGTLRTGHSIELADGDLLPASLVKKFTGYALVEFLGILSSASLRQYGILNVGGSRAVARVHYHDKYSKADVPGIYQTPRAIGPHFKTFAAISNPGSIAYHSDWAFSSGSLERDGTVDLAPGCSVWLDLEEFIGVRGEDVGGNVVANFRIKNPQPLMVWFFWQDRRNGNWHGQHF